MQIVRCERDTKRDASDHYQTLENKQLLFNSIYRNEDVRRVMLKLLFVLLSVFFLCLYNVWPTWYDTIL